jgi:hypothetical protein
MTATLERELTDADIAMARACECERNKHHPGQGHCDQEPCVAARLVHYHECTEERVFLLCEDCLDYALKRAASLVGYRCADCKFVVLDPADLVGPVVSL